MLLVVAADEGVMPQTREHVAACELLGLRRAVVAMTKLDRVGAEVAELAGDEARELLADRWEAEVVACSSRTGEGMEAVRGPCGGPCRRCRRRARARGRGSASTASSP